MALTSPIQSPAPVPDTPTPYRLPTSAVRVWTPREPTTTEIAAIRERIYPTPRRWWQFPLPTLPWEAVLAIRVYTATVALGGVAITAVALIGTHR